MIYSPSYIKYVWIKLVKLINVCMSDSKSKRTPHLGRCYTTTVFRKVSAEKRPESYRKVTGKSIAFQNQKKLSGKFPVTPDRKVSGKFFFRIHYSTVTSRIQAAAWMQIFLKNHFPPECKRGVFRRPPECVWYVFRRPPEYVWDIQAAAWIRMGHSGGRLNLL